MGFAKENKVKALSKQRPPRGSSLRAARRREGLTQKALATLAEIPQAHISLMERGKMAIGVTRAKRLAKALNTGYKVFL